MSYLEAGTGRPVLLLHGNPTSSYLRRHVLAEAADRGGGHRWIAPDLMGMGNSGKPESDYRLADHIAYLDEFIASLGLAETVVVGHDWGVAIALDLLRRRPSDVRAVALMEGHLRPLPSWEAFDEGGRELFQRLRTPGLGEQMVLADNFFLDILLPAGLVSELDENDMAHYREHYPDAASRRPLLQWAREIPVAGEPADVDIRMKRNARHLAASTVPKLLVHGRPGVLVDAATIAWCRAHLRNVTVADVGGPAGHFLPEDRQDEVADVLLRWVDSLP